MVAPPEMSLLPEFKAELDERNVQYEVAESVEKVVDQADVIYMEPVVQADYTQVARRASRRRGPDDRRGLPRHPRAPAGPGQDATRSSCTRCRVWTSCRSTSIATRHARYWFEAFNGVVMRMALLALVLGAEE